MPTPGAEATVEETVTEAHLASSIGSGDLPVLGTPALLALVERAAMGALAGALPPDRTTVGARVELIHLAPTPAGARIAATARLDAVDGRKLRFSFEVRDPGGTVATGSHLRVIVDRAPFQEAAAARAQVD